MEKKQELKSSSLRQSQIAQTCQDIFSYTKKSDHKIVDRHELCDACHQIDNPNMNPEKQKAYNKLYRYENKNRSPSRHIRMTTVQDRK